MQMIRTLDEKHLESLFHSHFVPLCRFAVHYVKEEEVAREIVQDAFVGLWMKRDTIDLEKPVRTYLSTAVRNKCLNHLRDNRKFSSQLLELENLPHISGEDPDRLVEKDLQQQIESAVAELPEKCREVFSLSRFSNLKYAQIAEKMGISVKTVETQMTKALQHLRVRLGEYLTTGLIMIIFSWWG